MRSHARFLSHWPALLLLVLLTGALFAGCSKGSDDAVKKDVATLKDQPGDDVVSVGGAGLASTLIKLDLIDEYRLYIHPIVIGRGKPLFQPSDSKMPLQLAGTRTFGNGVVLLRYGRPV